MRFGSPAILTFDNCYPRLLFYSINSWLDFWYFSIYSLDQAKLVAFKFFAYVSCRSWSLCFSFNYLIWFAISVFSCLLFFFFSTALVWNCFLLLDKIDNCSQTFAVVPEMMEVDYLMTVFSSLVSNVLRISFRVGTLTFLDLIFTSS